MRLEPTTLIQIGTRTTYQATGDACPVPLYFTTRYYLAPGNTIIGRSRSNASVVMLRACRTVPYTVVSDTPCYNSLLLGCFGCGRGRNCLLCFRRFPPPVPSWLHIYGAHHCTKILDLGYQGIGYWILDTYQVDVIMQYPNSLTINHSMSHS